MISFTGGAQGGASVAQAAARRGIPCVMELGGIPSLERDAETLVVGTLSPGPVLDSVAALNYETRPVIVASRIPVVMVSWAKGYR